MFKIVSVSYGIQARVLVQAACTVTELQSIESGLWVRSRVGPEEVEFLGLNCAKFSVK